MRRKDNVDLAPLDVLWLFINNALACTGWLFLAFVGLATTALQVAERGLLLGLLTAAWGFFVIGCLIAIPVALFHALRSMMRRLHS